MGTGSFRGIAICIVSRYSLRMENASKNRRPIKARDRGWAQASARALKHMGFTPNQISILSVVFAAFAGVALGLSGVEPYLPRPVWIIIALLCILFRLLCNLFDGMIAVEGGMATRSGEIFNDFPDRPSDLFILVGAGYAIKNLPFGSDLGWCAATLAIMSAYVRYLGGAAGAGQFFLGPMAKQQRMGTMIAASILSVVLEPAVLQVGTILYLGLAVIVVGTVLTIGRRLKKISGVLNSPTGFEASR